VSLERAANRVSGPEAFRLQHGFYIVTEMGAKLPFDLISLMSDHNNTTRSAGLVSRADNPGYERPTCNSVQDLRSLALHSGPLTGREDDGIPAVS
jgi:hypothetical protein